MKTFDSKRLLTIFLVLLLVSGFSQADVCSTKNPLIAELKKRNVTILASPIKYEGCGGEWDLNGSCCEMNSMLKYVSKEANYINPLVESYKREVAEVNKVMVEFIQEMDKNLRASDDKSKNLEFININGSTVKKISQEWLNKGPAIELSERACLNTLHKIRSRSLCYVCSGASRQYFTEGKLNFP